MPPGIVSDGIVVNRRLFARLVGDQLVSRHGQSAEVTFSIPSRLATLRWVYLPRLPHAELREAARFKVKRHLPFPVEQSYVAASQMEGEEEAGMPTLVISVRREVVDSRADAIAAAGLNPCRAELEAQAILRVVERRLSKRSILWRDASLTIIDVGGENTHMYVVQNQRLQFIRGVKFGGEVFAATVAQSLGIELEAARHLLGHPSSELAPTGELLLLERNVDLSRDLEKLTREFLRLLRYFRSLHPERSYAGILDHLVVCGGLVGLHGFAEYLQSTLGLRVERARPITGMMGLFDRDTFMSVASRQEAFSVATGLALAGLGADHIGGSIDAEREFAWARAC